MDRMREHSLVIIEQALLVSHELIRVAILWHELWHEGLEEASRLYFTDHNPMGMIAFLEPLHDMLEVRDSIASRCGQAANIVIRIPKQLARSRSHKCSVATSMRLVKPVGDTRFMARNVIWRKPGRFITE